MLCSDRPPIAHGSFNEEVSISWSTVEVNLLAEGASCSATVDDEPEAEFLDGLMLQWKMIVVNCCFLLAPSLLPDWELCVCYQQLRCAAGFNFGLQQLGNFDKDEPQENRDTDPQIPGDIPLSLSRQHRPLQPISTTPT